MTYLSQRFLIVIGNHNQNEAELQVKIQHYQTIIQRSRVLKSDRTEYFLLYVTPHLPSYALQSPELLQFVIRETEKSKEILINLGKQLAIKPEHQFLAEGMVNLQAWFLAKQLKVDKVFGYSKTFIKFINMCTSIQYSWSQMPSLRKKLLKRLTNGA